MKYILLLIGMTTYTAVIAQVPSYVAPLGLVGWYNLDGNANDDSQIINNGTVSGALPTNDRNGNPNSAYILDGIDDFIQIPNHDSLNFEAFTISMWVKMESDASLDFATFISKNSTNNLGGDAFHIFNTSSNPNDMFGYNTMQTSWTPNTLYGSAGMTPGGFPDENIIESIIGIGPPFNASWWHVALRYREINPGAGFLEFFIDGVENGNMPYGAHQNNLDDIYIGVWEAYNNYSNIKVDEIGIWRRALSDCELKALVEEYVFPEIVQNGTELIAPTNGTATSFQWINCDNNNAPISNATDSIYSPSQTGNYAVITTYTNCTNSDTSDCFYFANASLNELNEIPKILFSIVDLMGRETVDKPNTLLIYIYSDGTKEKVFRVE